MLNRKKGIFFIVLFFSLVTALFLQNSFFKEQSTNNSLINDEEYIFYESKQKFLDNKGISIPPVHNKKQISKNTPNENNTDALSIAKLEFLDKESELYNKYNDIYSENPFKFIDHHLVSVFKKYDDIDFISTDLKSRNSKISLPLRHQLMIDELTENELYGTWDNVLGDNFRAAMQEYDIEGVFSITSMNCKEQRCVATLSFDNENEPLITEFFDKLNQDANYHFYALTSYHMSDIEGTLIIIRTKDA